MSNGIIRIEFQIVAGQLKVMLNAPLETEQQREMIVQVLSAAIPIAVTYRPSIILKPSANGTGALPPPPAKK